jgi:hypothetical protein
MTLTVGPRALVPPVSRSVVRPLVPLVRQAPLQLPPPQTVHAVLPHTAYRRRSPPAFGRSRQGLLALGAIAAPFRLSNPHWSGDL